MSAARADLNGWRIAAPPDDRRRARERESASNTHQRATSAQPLLVVQWHNCIVFWLCLQLSKWPPQCAPSQLSPSVGALFVRRPQATLAARARRASRARWEPVSRCEWACCRRPGAPARRRRDRWRPTWRRPARPLGATYGWGRGPNIENRAARACNSIRHAETRRPRLDSRRRPAAAPRHSIGLTVCRIFNLDHWHGRARRAVWRWRAPAGRQINNNSDNKAMLLTSHLLLAALAATTRPVGCLRNEQFQPWI